MLRESNSLEEALLTSYEPDLVTIAARAVETCSACPKACHGTCPVSQASPSETLTAWGKMNAVAQLERRPVTAEISTAVHACTGCMRCTTACRHENPVTPALFAARQATISAGLQPRGAASTLATFQQAQNPFGRELASLASSWRAQRPVRYPLFPGCSTLVKRPALLEETLEVSDAFGAAMGVSRTASRCCGYPLYAAGALDTFVAHARSMASALLETPELAVLDAGCAYTFRVLYPAHGVPLPTRVLTVIEALFENLPHAPARAPLSMRVGYHDACHLGRGLGLYDEPRALVTKAVETLVEAAANRREAGCSGGGGLVPRTMVETSVEIARRQGMEICDDVEVPLVSACPTSTRMFERSGRRAFDLVSLLARWVNQP